jgi:hypothetical protein
MVLSIKVNVQNRAPRMMTLNKTVCFSYALNKFSILNEISNFIVDFAKILNIKNRFKSFLFKLEGIYEFILEHMLLFFQAWLLET